MGAALPSLFSLVPHLPVLPGDLEMCSGASTANSDYTTFPFRKVRPVPGPSFLPFTQMSEGRCLPVGCVYELRAKCHSVRGW